MDFPYLKKVTQLNIAAIAALARAPMPPAPVVEGAVSTDTGLSWARVPGAATYVVRWRRTDASVWEHSLRFAEQGPNMMVLNDVPDPSGRPTSGRGTTVMSVRLPHIRVDDWVFGVSSVAEDGTESPVAAAVPGGAFEPWVNPPPRQGQ